jgi:hypothetical protein
VGGVAIVATWFQPSGVTLDPRLPGVMRSLGTVSSATGEYALCGVRLGQRVTLRVSVAGAPVGEVSAQVPAESRILLLDLPVREDAR